MTAWGEMWGTAVGRRTKAAGPVGCNRNVGTEGAAGRRSAMEPRWGAVSAPPVPLQRGAHGAVGRAMVTLQTAQLFISRGGQAACPALLEGCRADL